MKVAKYTFYFIFMVTITFFICELVCRINGLKPYEDYVNTSEVEPKLCADMDSVFGYSLLPGYFTFLDNDTVICHATHNNDCRRITSNNSQDIQKLDKVIFIGCSFTYGDGLEDTCTHPYILQQLFNNAKINLHVENWGVGGYGAALFFLQAKEVIRDTSVKFVVINYGSFQDQRTACSRSLRKSLSPNINERQYAWRTRFPYFAFDYKGDLILKHKPLSYQLLPFQKKLALVELMDNLYCKFENRNCTSMTKSALEIIIDILQKKGIKVILSGISGDSQTIELVENFKTKGYTTLLYGFNSPEYTMPDGHPNFKANRIFADSLYSKITSILSVNNQN